VSGNLPPPSVLPAQPQNPSSSVFVESFVEETHPSLPSLPLHLPTHPLCSKTAHRSNRCIEGTIPMEAGTLGHATRAAFCSKLAETRESSQDDTDVALRSARTTYRVSGAPPGTRASGGIRAGHAGKSSWYSTRGGERAVPSHAGDGAPRQSDGKSIGRDFGGCLRARACPGCRGSTGTGEGDPSQSGAHNPGKAADVGGSGHYSGSLSNLRLGTPFLISLARPSAAQRGQL